MLDKSQLQAQGIHTIDTTPPLESQKLISLLKEHAPHIFSEGKLNLKSLANLLGIESSDNHYALSFLGKQEANALYNSPATKELRSEPDRSSDFDTTGNAIIIGDNLHALKTLRTAYYGKVKMIYIDPPYNTGSDGFIYRDHFDADYRKILQEKGFIQTDEEGKEILSEALNFCQNTAGDKSHSGWLSFMYPRLRLAQDLLRDDGVIFISIDDNEQANLKLLCDEIFGEHNFVACLPRLTSAQRPAQEKYVAINHDYLLIYTKNKIYDFNAIIERDSNAEILQDNIGKFLKNDTSPILASSTQGYSQGGDYDIEFNGKIFKPIDSKGNRRRWLWSKERMEKAIELGIVVETKTTLRVKNYIDKEFEVGTNTMVDKDTELGMTTFDLMKPEFCTNKATKELDTLGIKFNFPKPTKLVKDLIRLATNDGDIVMDFFAGSGTTAHAVMELNAEDKNNGKQGNRKFILVQLDEAIDEKANKVAYDFCKSLGSENPTIADITIERVKRAGEKIREEKFKESNGDSTIDTGFKVFSLIDKRGLTPQDQDLLTLTSSPLTPYQKAINLALHAGRTLDTRIQPVIESKLYRDERNFYLIACDKEVQKHLTADKNKDIFLSGYEDIAIQDLLNLQASIQKTRLKVLF